MRACLGKSLMLLALVTGATVTGCRAPAVIQPLPDEEIFKTDTPVVIDGSLDEPCWRQTQAIRADYLHGREGEPADPPRMIVKYAWDDHYLYIAYETFDRDLRARGLAEPKGPPGNKRRPALNFDPNDPQARLDVVEFFISFGDKHLFWELHHNAANDRQDIWVTVPADCWPLHKSSMTLELSGIVFFPEAYVKDDGNDTVAAAVKLKCKADGRASTVNDSNDVDTGYTAEIRLPWQGIGAPNDWRVWLDGGSPGQKVPGPWSNIAGHEIILLGVCQNGDFKDIYTHSSPRRITSWFHKQVDDWPRYVLVGPSPRP